MSTRSMIARETDGRIEAVYCHNTGWPEHHLPILTEFYTSDEAVAALMNLGNLSVLGPELGQRHDFDSHYRTPEAKYWCVAYGRDRGEENTTKRTYASEEEFLAGVYESWADYIYLFRAGRWLYRDVDKGDAWLETNE